MNIRRHRCPTPTKAAFLTREAAVRALRRLPVIYTPTAYYRCRGRWHLTSKGQRLA